MNMKDRMREAFAAKNAAKKKLAKEQKRQDRLYRQARLVYDETDRSADSDPYDVDRPTF